MKMGMKVMCAMILMAVIVLIVGLVGIFGMSQINKSRDEIAKVTLPSIIAPEIINEAQMAIQRGERTFNFLRGVLIGAMVLSIILAVATGIRIRRNMADIIGGLMDEARKLVKAVIGGSLATRGDPEKVNSEFRDIVKGVNGILDAILLPIGEGNRILRLIRGGNLREKVEMVCLGDHERMKDAVNGLHAWLSELLAYVTRIAHGDLTATMPKASEEDQIHDGLVLMKNNIHAVVADAAMLSRAAADGKMSTRADTTKHRGDFRKLVSSVNEILDAVTRPLNLAAEYADRISRGEISPKKSDNDKNDFKEIFLEIVAQNKPFFK
jgi:methyl-accepting chemotaxis protein